MAEVQNEISNYWDLQILLLLRFCIEVVAFIPFTFEPLISRSIESPKEENVVDFKSRLVVKDRQSISYYCCYFKIALLIFVFSLFSDFLLFSLFFLRILLTLRMRP